MKQKELYSVIIYLSYPTIIQIIYREKNHSVEYVLISELMFNG